MRRRGGYSTAANFHFLFSPLLRPQKLRDFPETLSLAFGLKSTRLSLFRARQKPVLICLTFTFTLIFCAHSLYELERLSRVPPATDAIIYLFSLSLRYIGVVYAVDINTRNYPPLCAGLGCNFLSFSRSFLSGLFLLFFHSGYVGRRFFSCYRLDLLSDWVGLGPWAARFPFVFLNPYSLAS